MDQPEPVATNLPRPWYYQNWFLIAAFILGWPVVPPFGILWPVWGLLIVRSPWHNHPLLKGLGWAMLFVGAILFVRLIASGGGPAKLTLFTLIPGLLVTLTTQVMWARFRLEQNLGGAVEPPQIVPSVDTPALPRRSRPSRRLHRRGDSRSSRAGR